MAPIVVVLLIAATLMTLNYRQNRTNERNEQNALRRIARLAQSYESDMQHEARGHYPSEARTRGVARRNDAALVSYTRSGQSLTTVIQFHATYEDSSMFGSSLSMAYRCYSFLFRKDDEGGPRKRTAPLRECDVA
ncbi:hypothetical protein ACFY0F_01010 [Streptomyces sp. NPDC001544]|uniref:hypothetical protein n=1 Tax=Streptomyces sp. NPDC001544 TaxID=3364584 RepID=UPI0036BB31EF